MDFVKHLETLGLEPGASPEEVRRAFRERMTAWQPERAPDSPSYQKDASRARQELTSAYRFLMNRYGLAPVDLEDDEEAPPPAAPSHRPPAARPKQPAKAPESKERIPLRSMLTRTVLVIGVIFLSVEYVIPAARDGRLTSWTESAIEYSRAKLAAWFPTSPEAPAPGAPPPRREIHAVQSLPRLTKSEVLQRYGEPRGRESGRWSYAGFSILFQDDSIASLLVRDSVSRN